MKSVRRTLKFVLIGLFASAGFFLIARNTSIQQISNSLITMLSVTAVADDTFQLDNAKKGKTNTKKKKNKKKKKGSASKTATFSGTLFLLKNSCDLRPDPTFDEIFVDDVVITMTVTGSAPGGLNKVKATINKSPLEFKGTGLLKQPDTFIYSNATAEDHEELLTLHYSPNVSGGHGFTWELTYPTGGFNNGRCTYEYSGTGSRQ